MCSIRLPLRFPQSVGSKPLGFLCILTRQFIQMLLRSQHLCRPEGRGATHPPYSRTESRRIILSGARLCFLSRHLQLAWV